MDDELRMKLADIGGPEALAECIVNHYPDLTAPVPLEMIAEAVGIYSIEGKRTDSFEGVLVTDDAKSKGEIAYNKESIVERQRFTIAHEIGHFLIPTHGARAQCAKTDMSVFKSQDPNRAKEAEANRFAASLLMPRKLLSSHMRQLGSPETEHILVLKSRYGVSKEAMARRYVDISDHSCAVIFSRSGLVRSFSKSDSFPFLELAKDQPLPNGSLSARGKGEQGHLSEWTEATPETWLGSSRRLRGKTIYEQYLQQADGYRLTMLTIEDDPADEEDVEEEGDLEESWTPRFRRR